MISQWRRILRYRDFLYFLVVLDIKRRYRQSFIGIFWVFIQPMALMLVFTAVFSRWYKEGPDSAVPYPVFAYAGLVPWTLFSRALQSGVPRIASYGSLIQKIAFPRSNFLYIFRGFVFLKR